MDFCSRWTGQPSADRCQECDPQTTGGLFCILQASRFMLKRLRGGKGERRERQRSNSRKQQEADLRVLSLSLSLCSVCSSLYCHRDNHIPEYIVQPGVMVPCSVVHPAEPHSCFRHAMLRWMLGFKSSWTIYAVVHILPLLLFRAKSILRRYPVKTY